MAKKRGGNNGSGMEHVADYHKELQLCLREHESKFDNAVLLVAGGAFTISAAFISDLPAPLSAGAWLAISWFAWGLCLVVGVGGHLVGAHATKRVLNLLDSQVYDFQVLMSGRAAKLIKPLNLVTFVLLIVGFVAFGRFTFANLDFGGHHGEKKSQEDSKAEGRQQEALRQADEGAQRTVTGSAMAAPQTGDSQVSSDHDRQASAPASSAASAAAAGTDSTLRAQHTDKGQADSTHSTQPAAGLATAAQEVDKRQ